ncbi:MAG: C-GCAxxG-C-C family (seleno)protein [Peptococcaceae bacterium]
MKRNNEELIKAAREKARDYFKTGMNCAECVLKAVLDLGLSDLPPSVIALATGFGGGIGLSGNNCGALSGAILAVSSVHGRTNPLAGEKIADRIEQLNGEQGVYRLFNQIPKTFQEKFGEVNCGQLVKDFQWHSREQGKFCQDLIGEGAAIAVYWILAGSQEGYGYPFGPNVGGYR